MSPGLVAIQGSAGSGKTTVGLHRVAYLAYQEPQRFRPEKMFVVVPNEALVHYVSRVLPALGVEGVAVTTFARFAARLAAQLFPRLPVDLSDETPPSVSRAKSHAAMLRAIDRTALRIAREVDERVRAAADRWPGRDAVVAAWVATAGQGEPGSLPIDTRVSLLAHWLAGKRTLPGVAAAARSRDHAQRDRAAHHGAALADALGRRALGRAFRPHARASPRRSRARLASHLRSSI